MKKSVWTDSVKMPEFKRLEGNIKTDVLVIGGGICGLLCAYRLKNKGIDYVLVEGEKICGGITKNTTGKITSQHGLIYSTIIASRGKEMAAMYLSANEKAVASYRELCKDIECDFEEKTAYTYSVRDRSIIEREVQAVNDLGFKAEFFENTELPVDIKGAIGFHNQAEFNPLKLLEHIAAELNIYENTFVKKIVGNKAFADTGTIEAERIIVATHFPFINFHGSYFLKLYQHRSYVAAFESGKKLDGMYVDEDNKGISIRGYKDLVLVGGGGHRTGKSGCGWEKSEEFIKRHYNGAEVKYRWATQDTMSLDGVPYIGAYSKNTPDLFVATGFNKWGMTSAMVAADMLSDMVLGKRHEYEELFSPQRSMAKMQLCINGLEATVNLLTPTVRRCPHMGCALKWNKYEHTWDCPCHGSRFDENGEIIDNPAMRNL